MHTKVAVVTGSNKGIGFAIVRALCKEFQGDVYLTARNELLGQEAVQQLEAEGLRPKFHQLDINDLGSIERLRDFLQSTYKGLDVLVNNAGVKYKPESTAPLSEQAEVTLKTNYFATLDACKILFPILRANSRVCQVSSGAGKWALDKISQKLRDRLLSTDIEMDELNNIVKAYVKAAQNGKIEEEGFYEDTYAMSKLCLNVMTTIQQREMDKTDAEDILINACTPGYVATDLTSHKGHLSIDEGAVTPTYIALLPPNIKEPRGKFLRDKKVSEGWV